MVIFFQEIGMSILLWILGLIDSVFAVFSAAAGISEVTTDKGNMSLGAYFMQLDGVRKAFFIILIVSVGICAICTVVAV